jgi:2-keto-3-deoxy-L-fuconate dehydrogenase
MAPPPTTPALFRLDGKCCIVTGAGSGIGAAIAEIFGRAGGFVFLADLDLASAEATLKRIISDGGQGMALQIDIAQEASCAALVDRVMKEKNRCDVLVNNAGVGHVGTLLTTSPEDMARLWNINLMGMYHLSRRVLPIMVQAGRGSIINLGSVAGVMAMEDRFAYTITKHAVVGLTRSMALDFGRTGVRINAICPGRVETPFVEARLKEYAEPAKFREQMSAPHALKRMAKPTEIAAAALFLASDEASFMTGAAMSVDGGYTAGK